MSDTTYEVRESSRETPGESTLLRTAPTYWEAMELARDYSERGALAFVREVAPSLPPAAAEPDAFDFDSDLELPPVPGEERPYLCTCCHANSVDAEDGEDTCAECLRKA